MTLNAYVVLPVKNTSVRVHTISNASATSPDSAAVTSISAGRCSPDIDISAARTSAAAAVSAIARPLRPHAVAATSAFATMAIPKAPHVPAIGIKMNPARRAPAAAPSVFAP